MRLFITVATIALGLAGAAQAANRSWTPERFDSIEVGGDYEVSVVTGDRLSVRAQGDERELERMQVRVVDGSLQIKPRPGDSGMSRGPVRVQVVSPPLKAASLSGSGEISIDRVTGREFAGSVSGSGDMMLRQVDVRSLALSASGSGDMVASGRCNDLAASVSGSGDARLAGLRCGNMAGEVSGSGTLDAFASGAAVISAAGSGNVTVRGGARCTVSRAGSADVRCG